ncbi:hypothetical protein FACS189419_05190 [Planctomycetales bacterium]|nr:hypothetical protein FACS189419_05190 [Planctomycetales bacterium]
MPSGGKREGAGRPKGAVGKPKEHRRIKCSFALLQSVVKKIDRLAKKQNKPKYQIIEELLMKR